MKKTIQYIFFFLAFAHSAFTQGLQGFKNLKVLMDTISAKDPAGQSENFKYEPIFSPFTHDTVGPVTNTCIIAGVDTLVISLIGTNLHCNSDNSGTASITVISGTMPYTYAWPPTAQTTTTVTGLSAGCKTVQVWDGAGNNCVLSVCITEPPLLLVGITPPSPVTSCFSTCDGSASASPAGGVPPYTFSWNTIPVQTTATATGLCSGTNTVTVTDKNGCITVRTFPVGQPPPLNPNGVSTNVTCFGLCNGSVCASPTGGNAPYTYSWSTGATTSCIAGLCPGTYSLTLTDTKTCVATYTAIITQPTALTTSVAASNLLCNGVCTGSVTATASGGVTPYSYSWAPGGCTTSACTGLCAGNYTLTLTDANGCTKTATVSITQPAALNTFPIGTNINCFGQCTGIVNANASGGNPPYTYLWNPGGCTTSICSNLCAGTYTVNITDANGCTKTGTVSITAPPLLTVTLTKTNATCNSLCNGSVTATVTGGTPSYTYSWSPGGCTSSACSNLCAGTYSVLVTDNKGCTATGTITVNQPSALSTGITSTPALCSGVCNGTVSSSPSGGVFPYTYLWSPGGCTTTSCAGLCAGNYTLTLSDANGCSVTNTVTVTQPNVLVASVTALPNPLNCNGDCNGNAVASISGGTAPYTYLWNTAQTVPSITGLCAGVYSVTVTDANGCTSSASVSIVQPTPISVTTVTVNPTCNGLFNGSICAIAGGGTPGYSFSWLPGGQSTPCITGLSAGNYTLTVTDTKACAVTRTFTLTAPAVLNPNASVITNVSCTGLCNGSATAIPSGGTLPYTFLWSPGNLTTQTITGLCAGTYSVLVTDANNCTVIGIATVTQPASVLSANISSTVSSCTICNGSATVAASGGTSPYTYFWQPTGQTSSAAVGLCIGNHTVTVTDANGCITTQTTVINPVVTISVTVSGTSVSCFGSCDGVAFATPFGGVAPYTYLWSPGSQTTASATGLCANTYSVTVADTNGCFATSAVTFTNPPVLTATVSATIASCGLCNGSATVSATGGTGTYTYNWSGFPVQTTQTATGLCPGNYTVTVKDSKNCATTAIITVGSIPNISANPAVTNANCGFSDGSICLSPSGGTPAYTYLWAPGAQTTSCITGIPAGIYTVTITDAAGCSSTSAISVGNISGPAITVTSAINPVCNNDCNGSISVTASGANPPFTYLWSPGSQTTISITGLCAGIYIVQVTNALGCSSFSSDTLKNPPPISPNPTITNVSCNGGNNGKICLAPSGGISPYSYSWNNLQTTSCATGLFAGNYTVTITDAGGCSNTYTITVSQPTVLTVTISSINVTCNGNGNGTATAIVSGGTGTYTYLWSTGSPLPSIIGLYPGTYSVIVTDNNGCTAAASAVITQPALLTTTISFTNATCNSTCNGTASISASGGTLPYSYLWSPLGQTTSSITGLCPGNYAGTVTDAKGCTSSKTVTITQPPALSDSVTATGATCFGTCNGTASAIVNGGTPPYTYLWNPVGLTTSSVTGLCAGSYTLSVTDANGCNAIRLFSISQPSQLQANITSVSPSCFSGCNGSATSSPVGGNPPYTFLWNNNQTTATATGLCAGTHTLTLSDASGCLIVQAITITQPLPFSVSPGVAQATCGLCNGSISVVISGGTSPYTYLWAPTGSTTAAITGLCAGLYTVTVTDANGCTTASVIPVSNTTGPSLTVSGTNITCFGACNGSATVTATGATPFTYLWTPAGQTTSAVSGLCPAYPYFIKVTDINGCITIDSIAITQPPQLVSAGTVTNATCFGLCNGSITVNVSGGTLPYTYLWSSGQTIISVSNVCAGNYTLNITDANNCVRTNTFTVGQNTIITSTVTSTSASCNGLCNGTATVFASGGTLPYNYLWNPGGQTTSAATGLCAGTNTITITDTIGCIRIDSAIITQPAILSPNITATNPLCNGNCNGAVSASPTGGTSPYTYLWLPGGCSTSLCTGLCAGTYTLTLKDANNCSVTSTITLSAPLVLSDSATVVDASCSNVCNGSIAITATGGTPPYTYLWNPAVSTTSAATGLCAGIYSVTVTDTKGCFLTNNITVNIVTPVIANAGNDTSLCVGQTATLCSSSFNAASVGWYQLPGWTSIGNTTCISVSPPVGDTSYALIATNGICSDTDTVMVTINNYPVVIASNNTTICQGGSATICASGANVYQWYQIQIPAWAPVATGNCITISPSVGITNYGVIGMNGVCSDTDSVAVTVMPMPVANAGNDTVFCFGGIATLCSNSSNATSVAWYNLPAWTITGTTNCVTVSPPSGVNNYALIALNGICSDTDFVSVNVFPSPMVNAGSDVTILATESTQLSGSGGVTYSWIPSFGLSDTTVANPVASPSVTTTYTLIVTNANGCTARDEVTVTVVPDIIVNDGLSPNGDGINDVWEIENIELFPEALVEVYNRWGELLFRSVGYKEKWNCTYKGKPLPVGTYYYVINLNNSLHPDPVTGPITIMR